MKIKCKKACDVCGKILNCYLGTAMSFPLYYTHNRLYMISSPVIDKLYNNLGTGQDYYLETRGKTSCSGGNLIKDKEACILACDDLKIPKKSILGGYVCYKDSRGHCYQNGHNGAGASMVCTNKGSAAPPSE